MTHEGPIPCEFKKWKCLEFINIKKQKIAFKIRKAYLRTIFFLIALKGLCFKNVHTSMILEFI